MDIRQGPCGGAGLYPWGFTLGLGALGAGQSKDIFEDSSYGYDPGPYEPGQRRIRVSYGVGI